MNQKTSIIIGIILLLLVVVGAGAFLMLKKPQPQTSVVKQVPSLTQQTTPQMMQGTLKNLLSNGSSVKCSFDNNNSTESAKVSGTVYVSGGKMRGDFQAVTKEMSVASHMIVDSGTSYVWTDLAKTGFKFSLTDQQPKTAGQNQQAVMDQNFNYSCQNWTTDTSLFVLPSDITFTSLAIPSAPATTGAGTTTNPSSQCAVCNNIPAGASRDACKAQLHCP